jgi:type II secretory pathway predicted ATPase ExeA
MRWFNTAGPCQLDIHYMLPPLARLPQLQRLIEQRSYFVVHAPRQVGKTTAMMTLAQQLTETGAYAAVLLSVEAGAAFRDNIDAAEQAILQDWLGAIRAGLPPELCPDWHHLQQGSRISQALQLWAESCPRPLVVLIDEIDALQDEVLIAVLRQLRSGYSRRPHHFPQSLALIGLRDVRDYKMAAGSDRASSNRLNTASPFNVKVESLTLRNFTLEEVADLYGQHTQATGQVFTQEAIEYAFELTQGQPWLVNAIARQVVEVIATDVDEVITRAMVAEAKEILILRRDTHIDSLAERLQEGRVRRIIEPMLLGGELGIVPDDDRQFVIDLGLVNRNPLGGLMIANPIYREVLPRVLSSNTQDSLPVIQPTWLTATGELDSDALLEAFLTFWRQHAQPLLKGVAYYEIAPHIVLMAFLHRVANGCGTIEREYAIGSDRLDLYLSYRSTVLAMELKVWREGEGDPLTKGLKQLDRYLAGLSLDSGWLVIFDQRSQQPKIADRTSTEETQTESGRQVVVIRA